MHELSVVASFVETVEGLVREHKAKSATAIWIKVGPLSGVVPELLESAFDMYRKGTVVENARLVVEKTPLKALCRACRAETERADYSPACPACGSTDLELTGGTDLILERVELETD
ncbi:MAG: hydrogenase maturation nickel metallochaperone HypA [Candidatus Aminicenantes bacterium]|nr:hydrogenase maturation nickel metallochaperone HypA [Candidatus Aminicenantes bacterium]